MVLCVLSLLLVGSFVRSESLAEEWTDTNFETNLVSKGGKAFVMFFAPWCGHCKALKGTWDLLATGAASSSAAIVKVDCTEKGQALCKKHNVGGYPTLKFFSSSEGPQNVVDYDGGRTHDQLESFVLENTRPSLTQITSDDELSSFIISTHRPAVVGFFSNSNSPLLLKLTELSNNFRKSFHMGYTVSQQLASKVNQQPDVVVLYWQPQYHTKMEPDSVSVKEPQQLEAFLSSHKQPIVGIRNPSNEIDFSYPLVTAYMELDPVQHKSTLRQLRNRMIVVARKHSTVKFAISSHTDYSELLGGIRTTINPNTIYLVAYNQERRKFVFPTDISTQDSTVFQNSLDQFVANFLKGDVYAPHFKSEATPATNNGLVKVVVGNTFEDMVMNSDQDVFIELYAPWCGHCKKLEPIFESLGALLSEETHLVIAKMDATANEFSSHFPVRGFPTIFLAKAGDKSHPVPFEGERTLGGFVEFLRKHTSLPLKFQGELPDAKEDL